MTYLYWIHLPNHKISEGYIGITNNYKKRWNDHKTKKSANSIVNKAINKYKDLIVYEVIWQGSEEGALQLEAYFRPTNKIGWNISPGGNKPPLMTTEAALKAVKTKKDRGYTISQETKNKIGIANSKNLKNRFVGANSFSAKLANIYCYKTNELVAEKVCLSEWARQNKYNRPNLCKTVTGERNHAHGYYVKYINKYNS